MTRVLCPQCSRFLVALVGDARGETVCSRSHPPVLVKFAIRDGGVVVASAQR